jgi:hypothetical protein
LGSFLSNYQSAVIQSENEAASMMSNFSTEYIIGVITDLLDDRFNTFSIQPKPNFVLSYEANFKEALSLYPADKDNITKVREDTYIEIINLIAKKFNINIVYNEDLDSFSLARYMYDFFISNYDTYLCLFFSTYITREKDGLYEALHLENSKKSKDISTIYNKKMYSDMKIAIINANLDRVIGYISTIDFDMQTMLEYIYINTDQYIIKLFTEHLQPQYDLFQSAFVPLLQNQNIYPSISTYIKLNLQRMNIPQDGIPLGF